MQKLTAFGLTDVGMQRAHNEDYFAIAGEVGFYLVCDGMGGHASGEVASKMCADNAVSFIHKNRHGNADDFPYETDFEEFECALISNAVQYANERVYIAGMRDPKLEGMGTTIVAIRALQDEVVLAHVGDSRIYRWQPGGKLEQITRDHSLLNFKIDRGELTTAEEISNFKQGNVIVRAMGLKDYVEPEVQVIDRRAGDIFLLCSDGLTDLVDDWSIENVLEANYDELDEACGCLIRMANDRGGKDNITVLLVRVDDDPVDDPDVDESMHDEVTDPRGVGQVAETTQPRGLRAQPDDDTEEIVATATADTDPNLRPVRANAAPEKEYEEEDDDWYSNEFEVDYRDEEEVDPLGGGEVTFGDLGRDDREEVLEETWRMTGGRTDVATDPTLRKVQEPPTGPVPLEMMTKTRAERDPGFVDGDEPVSFGKPTGPTSPPGRLAARRAKPPPTTKMPSVAPRARVGAGAKKKNKREKLPATSPVQPAAHRQKTSPSMTAKRPTPPPIPAESSDELPSIIIDDSLLE